MLYSTEPYPNFNDKIGFDENIYQKILFPILKLVNKTNEYISYESVNNLIDKLGFNN